MNKLIATIVASTFVFGSAAVFAADAKKEELTQEQRTEMRNRADKLTQERAQATTPVKSDAGNTPKATSQPAKKLKKTSRHNATAARPKA